MNRTNLKTSKLTFLGVMLSLTIVFVAMTAIPTTSASMALLIFIPTIITSIIQGPKAGALLGFSAGVVTLLRALLAPASPFDYFFINPLVAIVPRIFVGVVPYYIYFILKKLIKSDAISYLIAGVSGAVTNTGLVILALYMVYKEPIVESVGTSFGAFAILLITTSMLLEATVAGIGTMSVIKVYDKLK